MSLNIRYPSMPEPLAVAAAASRRNFSSRMGANALNR